MSLIASLGCLWGLRALPYSTSLVLRAAESDAVIVPEQTFSLGALTWDVAAYQRAPELQAFRDAFAESCSELIGVDAARCVLEIVRSKSANGEPRNEFVDASFQPSTVLAAHLAGAPGHCTSRSFMTATALLAMGKPARIVQLLPPNSEGHNVIELYDPRHGWLIFDPHFESSVLRGEEFVSASMLSHLDGGLRWRRTQPTQPDPNLFAGSTVNFPEPWLYTRVGERCAPWPFRGCFAQIGPSRFMFGPAQKLTLALSVMFAAFGLVAAARALRSAQR